jgi:hypothetical protein
MKAQFNERALTELGSGLAQARAVLRRRREVLQGSLAGIEVELRELTTIDADLAMAVEVLREAAVAREKQE